MTKQEFLAMSLPFELKMWNKSEPYKVYEMDGFFPPNAIHYKETNRSDYFYFETKPILRTLSDLTKEIEHNGEKFVPSKEIIKHRPNDLIDVSYVFSMNYLEIESLPFWAILKLIEWHFDIANLIPVGEAIDINTLSINPYK